MTTEDIIGYGKLAGILIPIVGTIGGLTYKYILHSQFLKIKIGYKYFLESLEKAHTIDKLLTKELSTNGGSSIKDAIKRIESKLSVIDGKHRAGLSLKSDPVWESDINGNCVWVNFAYTRLTGFDFSNLRGHGWMSIITEEDRSRVREQWNHAIKEKRTFLSRYRIMRNDDKVLTVTGHAYPIISEIDDKISGYIGTFENIS